MKEESIAIELLKDGVLKVAQSRLKPDAGWAERNSMIHAVLLEIGNKLMDVMRDIRLAGEKR